MAKLQELALARDTFHRPFTLITTSTIIPYVDWDVIPELSSSDHFPIIMTLKITNYQNH